MDNKSIPLQGHVVNVASPWSIIVHIEILVTRERG